MTFALTAGQSIIATLTVAALALYALVAVIDTIRESRREYEEKKQRLLIAAVEARLREFERDHPNRKRIGLTEGDE